MLHSIPIESSQNSRNYSSPIYSIYKSKLSFQESIRQIIKLVSIYQDLFTHINRNIKYYGSRNWEKCLKIKRAANNYYKQLFVQLYLLSIAFEYNHQYFQAIHTIQFGLSLVKELLTRPNEIYDLYFIRAQLLTKYSDILEDKEDIQYILLNFAIEHQPKTDSFKQYQMSRPNSAMLRNLNESMHVKFQDSSKNFIFVKTTPNKISHRFRGRSKTTESAIVHFDNSEPQFTKHAGMMVKLVPNRDKRSLSTIDSTRITQFSIKNNSTLNVAENSKQIIQIQTQEKHQYLKSIENMKHRKYIRQYRGDKKVIPPTKQDQKERSERPLLKQRITQYEISSRNQSLAHILTQPESLQNEKAKIGRDGDLEIQFSRVFDQYRDNQLRLSEISMLFVKYPFFIEKQKLQREKQELQNKLIENHLNNQKNKINEEDQKEFEEIKKRRKSVMQQFTQSEQMRIDQIESDQKKIAQMV